jgi:hypothetical protein
MGLIILMLPLSILVLAAVALIAVSDVAFRDPPTVPAGRSRVGLPGSLVGSVPAGFVLTLTQLTTGTNNRCKTAGCESHVPEVTGPEAQAIADEVRQQGAVETERVLERSRQHRGACPMLNAAGLCACSITRPLSCIGRCTVGGDSPEWASGVGDAMSAAFRRHLESQHVNSETQRLDDALAQLLVAPPQSAV